MNTTRTTLNLATIALISSLFSAGPTLAQVDQLGHELTGKWSARSDLPAAR